MSKDTFLNFLESVYEQDDKLSYDDGMKLSEKELLIAMMSEIHSLHIMIMQISTQPPSDDDNGFKWHDK